MADDAVWNPFATLDFPVTGIVGALVKDGNTISYSFVSTDTQDVSLGGGLLLKDAAVLVESIPGGGAKISLLGDVDLGPLGEAEVEGVPTTNDNGETEGCFTQTTALGLGTILVDNALLSVCITGGNTTAVTFSGEADIEGTVQPVAGVLSADLSTASINLDTLPIGPGIILNDVTLEYDATSPFFELDGSTTLGSDSMALGINVAGLYKNKGNAYLTPSMKAGRPLGATGFLHVGHRFGGGFDHSSVGGFRSGMLRYTRN